MKTKLAVLTLLGLSLLGFKYNDNLQAMGLKFSAPTIFGKANVFQPEPGEIIYDSSESKFYGHDHSDNWVELSSGAAIMPTGVVLPFGGTSAPNGFLIADGTAVSRTEYAALFAVIGTSFGIGDGSTTFNLPDLRGRFIRGVDGSAGNDPDSSGRTATNGGNGGNNVGSIQPDAYKSHSHTLSSGDSGSYGGPNVQSRGGSASTATTSGSGGTETRPKNIYMNYIIKY